MFSVMVLCPGGGYAHDTTGSLTRCERRSYDLRQSNRRPRALHHIIDETTGRKVT